MCPTHDRLMNDQSHNQDDLTTGIFGDSEYAQPRTAPKEFKPWHKPRKQFVRREQLSALLQGLYEKRKPGDPLCYLGLPGTDLIDLRYLHKQLCYASGRPLRFLGFNTEAQRGNPAHVQLNVSLDEVRQLANVDPQSAVMHDDFRRIGNSNSVAWHRTRQFAPVRCCQHRPLRRACVRPAAERRIGLQGTGGAGGYSTLQPQSMAPARLDENKTRDVRCRCRAVAHRSFP